jgi:hypothetical protein
MAPVRVLIASLVLDIPCAPATPVATPVLWLRRGFCAGFANDPPIPPSMLEAFTVDSIIYHRSLLVFGVSYQS